MMGSIRYKGLGFLTIFVFVMAACAVAVAENGDEDSVIAVAESGNEDLEKEEVPFEQRMLRKISVEFSETPIDDVIAMMAEKADVDIIKSPKVTGAVTAKLTNVPLEEALNNILAAHGYSYVASRNMIRIAPAGEILEQPEKLVSKIYRITYADVTEVERALRNFISGQGELTLSKGTSHIIVTDTESKITAIDGFIEQIDYRTPQVLVEVRIYDITVDEDFDLGIEWNIGRNSTERESLGTAITVPDSTTFGVGMDTSPGDGGSTRLARTRTSTPFVAGSYDEKTGGSIRLGLLNDTLDVDIALNILHKQQFAELLANPRILVLDNETANFEIIREIPYTEVSTTGNTATETVKFKPVGVALVVTPHVTREGMLRLHITPTFGVRVGTTDPPTVDKRTLDTIALVKDGQTVVLGGLRKKETSQDIWKIPILGDIPLLGGLFQSETESELINELLIFITPRIIMEPTLTPAETERLEGTIIHSPEKPTLRLD